MQFFTVQFREEQFFKNENQTGNCGSPSLPPSPPKSAETDHKKLGTISP